MKDIKSQQRTLTCRALGRGLLIIFFLASMTRCTEKISNEEILQTTTSMEEAWRSGNKDAVASFYSEDAYLIHPGGIAAQGRKGVDAYWGEFSGHPVDWKLTSFLITETPEEIFELSRYKEGDREMKLWTDLDIQLPDNAVFQYGMSDLTYTSDGKTSTSTVEFILVWKETGEGWRIFMDTYR